MKKILLDTNAYTAFKRGCSDVLDILQHADTIGVNTIVLGELTAGFLVGTKYKKNIAELNEFLITPRINIFPIDADTVPFYAKIYEILGQKGKPIPTNDLWIAATCLQYGYKLCTFDKHFQVIENLIITTTLAEFLG